MDTKSNPIPEPDDQNYAEISDIPTTEQEDEPLGKQGSSRRVFLASKYTPQQKYNRIVLTSGGFLGVLILLLLVTNSALSGWVWDKVSSMNPLIASSSTTFYLQPLPTWGQVTVDGKITKLPLISNSEAGPLTLRSGIHTVKWQGEPFNPLSCYLLVNTQIPDQTNICETRPTSINNQKALLINFVQQPALDQLTLKEHLALTSQIQQLLTAQQTKGIVQPGELYLSENGVKQAKGPLQVKRTFTLDTDTTFLTNCRGITLGNSFCFINGHDCRLFCTLIWPRTEADNHAPIWDIAAIVRPGWEYNPEGSSKIETVSEGEQFMSLRISRSGKKWKTTFHQQGASSFDDPNCIGTMSMLTTTPKYQLPNTAEQQYHQVFISGKNSADGCVVVTSLIKSRDTENHWIIVIMRFGILIAVGQDAQKQWPDLPIAQPETQRIVQNIMKYPTFAS